MAEAGEPQDGPVWASASNWSVVMSMMGGGPWAGRGGGGGGETSLARQARAVKFQGSPREGDYWEEEEASAACRPQTAQIQKQNRLLRCQV